MLMTGALLVKNRFAVSDAVVMESSAMIALPVNMPGKAPLLPNQ